MVATLGAANVPIDLNLSSLLAPSHLTAPLTVTASLAFMGAVVAGALAIWWAYPAAKMWRRGLRPLPLAELPELDAALSELCEEAGLRPRPAFVWNPLQLAPAAVAFGRLRRRYVGLSGGLVVESRRDPPAFRAILRHELAHLGSGDAAITYFAVAIWWSYLALGLVPVVLLQLLPALFRSPPFGLSLPAWIAGWGWRLAGLTLLVYLTRNAVLRTREAYADARAAQRDGAGGALRRVLERLPRPTAWWRRGLAVHPDPLRRRRWLDDPEPLFRIGFWEALGVGCVAAVANTDMVGALTVRVGDVPSMLVTYALTGFAVSAAASAVIGLGLWRRAFAALARGRRPGAPVAVALGLAAGLLVGPRLSLSSLPIELTGRGRFAGLGPAPADLLVDGLVLVGALLVARWISGVAPAWLAWRLTGRRRRLAWPAGCAAVGLVLGAFITLGLLAMLLAGLNGVTPAQLPPLLFVTAGSPLGVLVSVTLWAFPLAAHLQRGDGLPGPGREITVGLAAGLAFWPVYLLAALVLRPGPLVGLALDFCIAEAALAGWIACRAARPAALRGVLAAFCAACATLPLALLPAAQVGAAPAGVVLAAGVWLELGTVAALPFALLGAALARRRSAS